MTTVSTHSSTRLRALLLSAKGNRWTLGFWAVLAILTVAAGLLPAQTVPTNFAIQSVVLEPFVSSPAGFAFLPDGRILIVEKDSGNVRLAAVGANTSALIATVAGVQGGGERGLLGVAVDPDWPARPYVYFHSSHVDSTIHVTMYTASGQLSNPASTNLTLGSPYVLLKNIRDLFEHHNGGTLRFGPDHCLYVSAGDDGSGCDSQDVNLANGKILRLDVSRMPGTGSGPPPLAEITPPDNPIPGPSATARLVYAWGLRNPFRFTIDLQTGKLYIGDVGFLSWEELDEIVPGDAGRNYGWPVYEGFEPTLCCPQCTNPPFTDPIYVYPNPKNPDTSVAVTAGPLYRRVAGSPSSFPFEYEGSLFFADFYEGWIRRLVHTGLGWSVPAPVPGQPSAENWADGIIFISDLQIGPDGGLYFMRFISGSVPRGVHRIVDIGTTDAAPAAVSAITRSVPNPARSLAGVTIAYAPAAREAVRLRIYDATGRLVRVLRPSTPGTLKWDGRDDRGVPVGSGTYVYRLEWESLERAQGKITLVD